jgi:DNA polymerase-1
LHADCYILHTTVMNKLLLIDGNAIMHRAYHALPSMTSRAGKPVNAVYGLVSMLLKTISDLNPTYIVFTFDRKEKTFRKEIHIDYQAHRPQMHKDLGSQFEIAKDVIAAFGIPIFDKAGYEADDVIGTLAKKAVNSKQSSVNSIIILTGDRDLLQLVGGKVKLYMPVAGLSSAKLFGEKETVERIGVPPSQIVDYKALVGDPSDNYKGVPGIGPKTAIRLLQCFKTLKQIYDNLDSLPQKTRELLQKNKDSAFTSQTLAKIVCDLDLDFDVRKTNKWQLDSGEALSLFEEIGFKTLGERVKKVGREISKEKQMTLV